MLIIYFLISLLTAGLTLILGTYVLLRNPKAQLNRVFLLLAYVQALYCFAVSLSTITSNQDLLPIILNIYHIWPLILTILLHFALIYTEYRNLYLKPPIIVLLYCPALIMTALFVSGSLEITFSLRYWGWQSIAVPSPMMGVLMGLLLIVGIITIILLIKQMFLLNSRNKRTQTGLILAGFLAPWLSGLADFYLYGVLNLDIPPPMTLAIGIESVLITIAIAKYKLFVLGPAGVASEIVNSTNDYIFLVNTNGFIEYANVSMRKLMKKTKSEIFGTYIMDVLNEVVADEVRELKKPGSNRKYLTLETVMKVPDSETIPVSMTITLARDKSDNIKGYVCIARDLSERLRMMDDIIEKEKKYKAVFNLSPSTIFLLDMNGKILDISKRFLDLFNYSRDEIIGKTINHLEFLPAKTKQTATKKLIEIGLQKGALAPFEITFLSRNGEERIGETFTTLLVDEQNAAIGALVIVTDVTDKRMAELKRLEAQEEIALALAREKELSDLKSRFISLISHEYRTPLTVILSSSSLIDKYYRNNNYTKLEEHIGKIQSAINNLVRMLENVVSVDNLGLTKSQVKLSLIEATVNVQSYISEVELLDKNRHPIEFYYSDEKIIFDTDLTLFRHIIMQTLTNSVKYSLPGSHVQLYLINNENYIEINITDNGIGIPEDYTEHEYEPFYRCCNVGSISGIGLGLSIVKKSVELLSGRISYKSEINNGTTFNIILPKLNTVNYYGFESKFGS